MNNAVFTKSMGNVLKHRDVKLLTTEKRRECLVSESNYHFKKFFIKNLLAIRIRKTEILMNKVVYLSVLELSRTEMYELLYDHVNPKYGEKKFTYSPLGKTLEKDQGEKNKGNWRA